MGIRFSQHLLTLVHLYVCGLPASRKDKYGQILSLFTPYPKNIQERALLGICVILHVPSRQHQESSSLQGRGRGPALAASRRAVADNSSSGRKNVAPHHFCAYSSVC